MAKRHCHGKTKSGKDCQAAPLRDSDYCSAHDPKRPDETRFGSPSQAARAGASPKPHQPRAVDVIRERIEADMEPVLAPLFDALDAERGVVVGSGDSAELEMLPDHPIRLAAVRELLDRAYGKAAQTMTHHGDADNIPIQVEVSADVAQAAHVFLENVRRVQENNA